MSSCNATNGNTRRLGPVAGKAANVRVAQKTRKRSGDDTERLVEALNDACELRGVARLRKLPTPFRIIGQRGGVLTCVPEKKSGADYIGTMLDGTARHVCAEVKRASERRFPLSRIEDHQRDDLGAVTDAGGVAVLVVIYGPELAVATVHAIPWDDVRTLIMLGTKSLGPEELAPYRVLAGECWLQRWVR